MILEMYYADSLHDPRVFSKVNFHNLVLTCDSSAFNILKEQWHAHSADMIFKSSHSVCFMK